MAPGPAVHDQTTGKRDDPAADRVQGDHADEQERDHHHGRAALPGAVSACDHSLGNADDQRNGEHHAARLGEPKPVTEPSPIASETRHA